MDNVINLFLPLDRHVDIPEYAVEQTEDQHLFLYEHASFANKYEANIAAAVFKYITQDVENMSLHEVDMGLDRLINTDITSWNNNQFIYDLDIVRNRELTEDQYYVRLHNFQTSCPHRVKHESRYTNGKYVSCYLSKLDFYTRILKWRDSYIPKTNVEEPQLPVIVNKRLQLIEIKIITAAFTGNGEEEPVHVFETYQQGLNAQLNKNTLIRDRFYYDFYNRNWTTKEKLLRRQDTFSIDLDPHFYLFFKAIGIIKRKIEYEETIPTKILAQLSMISLFGSNAEDEEKQIGIDTVVIALDNYYNYLHKSSLHVFDLKILTWKPSTPNKSEMPRITGQFMNLIPSIFIEMISRINAINQIEI